MFERIKSGPNAGSFVCLRPTGPAVRITEVPRSGRTSSGYGSRIPTQYMVRTVDQKWRRVYVVCYSNCATAYVRHGDVRTIVEIEQ
jgi:hypothetical protein